MFRQLNHLSDAGLFDFCPAGAGKPRAGGGCEYRASLSSQAQGEGCGGWLRGLPCGGVHPRTMGTQVEPGGPQSGQGCPFPARQSPSN